MTKLAKILLTAAFAALPAAAFAHCGPVQQGHTTVGCEQGVTVFRTEHARLPTISPRDAARLRLQRDQLAQRRIEADARARTDRRKLELEGERVRQQGFLIRDANSPLNRGNRSGYGYGYGGGFGGGFGSGGFGVGFPQGGFIVPGVNGVAGVPGNVRGGGFNTPSAGLRTRTAPVARRPIPGGPRGGSGRTMRMKSGKHH